MLKKILPLLIIPSLLFAANTISYTYNFAKPQVMNNVVYVEGCFTSVVPFVPSLPTKHVTLRLPTGEVAVSFDVEYSNPVAITGEFYIQPKRPGGRIGASPPRDYYTRASSVYSIDASYPSQVKSPRFFTHFRYGHSIFIASLRPVQYNPVTCKLQYYESITVKIATEKKRSGTPVFKFSPFIKSQLQVEVDNPETLEGLHYTPRDDDDYDYALITTEAMKDSWGDFLDFNTRRALKTKLVTIEHVNENYPGSHQADKLKNYLIEQYNDHNIMFVMLGGDDKISTSNQIQSDAITHKPYDSEFKDYGIDYTRDQDIAADMFYETLDGQELEDLEWELYAARLPADNTTELNRIIAKTIAYSEEPVESAIKKVIMAGEKAWANINGGTCYGKDCLELLKGRCSKNGFTTQGFDNSFSFTDLYEKESNWSKSQLLSAINSGCNFVNHIGHSNNFMIMKLQTTDVPSLQNSAYYTGYTIGCYCGAWDNRKISYNASFTSGHHSEDCIAEEFICGTTKGPVAFISMTRFGLGDDGHASQDGTDGSCTRFWRYLFNGLFEKNMHYLALAQAYSKWINKQEILVTDNDTKPYYGQMEYVAYQNNALADPALSLWTATPQTLQPDHPTKIASNATSFVWDTKMPYTAVALLDKDGNDIICSQITGEDGKCEITNNTALTDYLSANQGGKLKIHVKAHNYFPYTSGEIQIGETDILNNQNYTLNNYVKFSNSNTMLRYKFPVKEKASISIYNSKGTLITYKEIDNQSGEISFNNRSNGIYYLRLKSKSIDSSGKFIIAQ